MKVAIKVAKEQNEYINISDIWQLNSNFIATYLSLLLHFDYALLNPSMGK